ncbi:DUF4255 domain-containing protein [Methanosarcina sp.]|uniref:DUF4255 domain-containing protein n=1 Tax=Methanosarcina sp. TaxID=2213 RepID=UPI003C7706CC
MSDYSAIADVGDTLIELLRDKMEDLIHRRQSIVMASPGEIEGNDDVRLSLFLYQVLENIHLKNQEMQITNSTTTTSPPIALDLYYMLTSYPSGTQDITERTKEEHRILGRIIQILNDNAILTGSILKGSLARNSNDLHIMLTPISLDDMTKMWTTFPDKPFRSSVCCVVTPVMIDSDRETSVKRVTSK